MALFSKQHAVRHVFRQARQVLVLGQRDRASVRQLLDVPAERVAILRNCVPDPGQARKRDIDRPVHILFLGRLGPRKGVPELLAALADPSMPSSGWQATLAGDGPVEHYRAEVDRLGLSDRVRIPGWLSCPETHQLTAASDILVLPSHGEGFAMAVLEGLAHGLAVVTTRVGAHDEVLEDDRNCLFVPVGDAPALAVALARLICDPDHRRALAQAGRCLYLSDFGIETYFDRLSLVHRDIQHGCSVMARQP